MHINLKCLRSDSARGNDRLFARYVREAAAFSDLHADRFRAIEAAISSTEAMGKMPLWEGYNTLQNYARPSGKKASRSIAEVRSGQAVCQFYAWMVAQLRPDLVLEFGAAFSASGMYWLAGLGIAGTGKLLSFEPNPVWCAVARRNFESVGTNFDLTEGTFEDNIGQVPPGVGIALIDAIHTKAFVLDQFALVRKVAAPGAIVIFDDIHFSADMRDCWQEVTAMQDLKAVWQIGSRVGLVELA